MLVDIYLQFIECAVHQLLRCKNVYPSYLFEQRTVHGITMWRCVHADVTSYIDRVLRNIKHLAAGGLLEEVVFITHDVAGLIVDERIVFQCDLLAEVNEGTDISVLGDLQEELRNSLLKLCGAAPDVIQLCKKDHTWSVVACINNAGSGPEGDEILKDALSNNEWRVDNTLLPESSNRDINMPYKLGPVSNAASSSSSSSNSAISGVSVQPIVSFRNDFMAVQILALN